MDSDPAVVSCSIAPWLAVRNGSQAVEFYKAAFGAVEAFRLEDPNGSVVAKLSVDGAEFWLSDEFPEHENFSPESLGGATARMILTISDPDTAFTRAIEAGATQISPMSEEHGWHVGRVSDPSGHHWEIGRPIAGF